MDLGASGVDLRSGRPCTPRDVDPLTGLSRRPFYREEIRCLADEVDRTGRPVALLVCSLDDFRTVNQAIGCDRADVVLTRLARRLDGVVRASSTRGDHVVVARTGGDSFAAATAPLSDRGLGIEVAGRIVSAFRYPIPADAAPPGTIPRVTVSVGLAYLEPGADAEEAAWHAAQAHSCAKWDGKDRYVVWSPDREGPR